MIKDKMNSKNKAISFYNVTENLNRAEEKVHFHWNYFKSGFENDAIEDVNMEQKERGEIPEQGHDTPSCMMILKGEMKAKLISLRKLALFWDASNLPKQVIQSYFNVKFDDLIHVIRVYDVSLINFNGRNAHHFYEFSIPYNQGYWFVNGLLPNRSYVAEIGVKLADNRFFPILRSNVIQTPKLEITAHQPIYRDVIQLHRHEDKPPKWTEHVSTYSYYFRRDNDYQKYE